MGVEQEFLRSYPAAILSYKKAVNFAEKNLGAEDGITQNLRSVYENAKNEVRLHSQLSSTLFLIFPFLFSSTWPFSRKRKVLQVQKVKRLNVWDLSMTISCRTSMGISSRPAMSRWCKTWRGLTRTRKKI